MAVKKQKYYDGPEGRDLRHLLKIGLEKGDDELMKALYESGLSPGVVAEKFDIEERQAIRIMKKVGTIFRRPGKPKGSTPLKH
jgi:hypothetical protein